MSEFNSWFVFEPVANYNLIITPVVAAIFAWMLARLLRRLRSSLHRQGLAGVGVYEIGVYRIVFYPGEKTKISTSIRLNDELPNYIRDDNHLQEMRGLIADSEGLVNFAQLKVYARAIKNELTRKVIADIRQSYGLGNTPYQMFWYVMEREGTKSLDLALVDKETLELYTKGETNISTRRPEAEHADLAIKLWIQAHPGWLENLPEKDDDNENEDALKALGFEMLPEMLVKKDK